MEGDMDVVSDVQSLKVLTSTVPPPLHTVIFFIPYDQLSEEKEDLFYLMMYSTHFVYRYVASDIWLRTTEIMRGNLLLSIHWLLFSISSKESFICTIPQTGYHIPWPLLHQL